MRDIGNNSNDTARVLVAGATGYLGRYVIQAFKERGYWVRALSRPKSVESSPLPVDFSNRRCVRTSTISLSVQPRTLTP